jgi:hypothetical protein
MTQQVFISKVIKKYGNKYNMPKTVYTSQNDIITIICPEHGEFQIRPTHHLHGTGCPKCYGSQ